MTTLPGAPPRCFALVPCAGWGQRAGGERPKQYQPVAGHAVVAHTLRALAAVVRIEATLVVLAPMVAAPQDIASSAGNPKPSCHEGNT